MRLFLRLTAVFLLLTILLLVGFIASGWGDPQPLGELVQTVQPGTMTILARGDQVMWLETKPLGERFSVRLTAVFQTGQRDIGYGLLLGTPHTTTALQLSPLGDLTLQQSPISNLHSPFSNPHSPIPILPWQPWPHVRSDHNEIWLDVDGDHWTVRVNRELLWVGEVAERVERVGVVGEGFGGKETAVVTFPSLELFEEK
ncbi:MAG: hypothetical protein KDE56_24795 [Anaerolineales bacterium]|nr:hypothetical protein [Anaerolineales bacterium]